MDEWRLAKNPTGGEGFDGVFDTVGGDNLQGCFTAAVNGTVASISTRCTCDLTPLHQKGLSLRVPFMILGKIVPTATY